MPDNLIIVRPGCIADSTKRYQQAGAVKNLYLLQHRQIGAQEIRQAMELFWETAYDPSLVRQDTLIPGALDHLKSLKALFGPHFLFLSRRPEALREVTEAWLREHGLPPAPVSAMVPDHVMLLLCASAFLPQVTDWTLDAEEQERVWRAGIVETIVRLFGVRDLLYIDFDEGNRLAIEATNLPGEGHLFLSASLEEAVHLLLAEQAEERSYRQ